MADPAVLPPEKWGWKRDDECSSRYRENLALSPYWTILPGAGSACLELIKCRCKASCKSRCSGECVAQRYDSRRSCKRSRVRSRPVPHEFSSLPANLRERRVLTSFIISVLTGNSKLLVKLSWACIGVYLPLAKLVVFQLCLNC